MLKNKFFTTLVFIITLVAFNIPVLVKADCNYLCNDNAQLYTPTAFCEQMNGYLSTGQFGIQDFSKCPGEMENACPMNQQAVCCCDTGAKNSFVTEAVGTVKDDTIKFDWQIPIDTINLSEPTCVGTEDNQVCSTPWIAGYIQGVYKYGLGIAGILAAIVLMAGGVLWLISAGDASKITQSKNLIIGSITGLMILFGSYILLKQINPNLTQLRAIKVGTIERIEIEGDAASPITLDQTAIAEILNVKCGEDSVIDIVNKSKNKVTYSQKNRGNSGPNNTVYLDCSSFASFVRKCAGLSEVPTFTGDIFNSYQIFDGNLDKLKAGDLVGWPPENKNGHVLIYLGNGKFGDCHGGTGRNSGQAISNNLSFDDIKKSAEKHNSGKLYIKQ